MSHSVLSVNLSLTIASCYCNLHRYFASNILILGRILSFKKEKKILSKYDGGLWMIENVPEELSYLPKLAMKIWYEDEQYELPESDLNKLRTYLIEEIKR